VRDVPVVAHIGDLDAIRVQIEHREAEPGPVLAVFSY
jgi:hypothetical protein